MNELKKGKVDGIDETRGGCARILEKVGPCVSSVIHEPTRYPTSPLWQDVAGQLHMNDTPNDGSYYHRTDINGFKPTDYNQPLKETTPITIGQLDQADDDCRFRDKKKKNRHDDEDNPTEISKIDFMSTGVINIKKTPNAKSDDSRFKSTFESQRTRKGKRSLDINTTISAEKKAAAERIRAQKEWTYICFMSIDIAAPCSSRAHQNIPREIYEMKIKALPKLKINKYIHMLNRSCDPQEQQNTTKDNNCNYETSSQQIVDDFNEGQSMRPQTTKEHPP
jgi:hypothetical protein